MLSRKNPCAARVLTRQRVARPPLHAKMLISVGARYENHVRATRDRVASAALLLRREVFVKSAASSWSKPACGAPRGNQQVAQARLSADVLRHGYGEKFRCVPICVEERDEDARPKCARAPPYAKARPARDVRCVSARVRGVAKKRREATSVRQVSVVRKRKQTARRYGSHSGVIMVFAAMLRVSA